MGEGGSGWGSGAARRGHRGRRPLGGAGRGREGSGLAGSPAIAAPAAGRPRRWRGADEGRREGDCTFLENETALASGRSPQTAAPEGLLGP